MLDKYENWLSLCNFISLNLINPDKFLKTPHERKVNECYLSNSIKDEIVRWIEVFLERNQSSSKCAEKSKELRTLGNEKYAKAEVQESLKLYSESIVCAPYDSEELLLALGNRSAASFRLRNYQDCLKDIDFAIYNFDNDIIIKKLVNRKKDALEKLKNDGLNNRNCPENSLRESQLPVVLGSLNESFLFSSSLLGLESNDFRSRRVIAKADLEVGDVLFVENPFSCVLLPDYFTSHCQLCCAELKCPIACSYCNDFLFCDQFCFKQAYDSFHKWECRGSRLIQDTGVGFLALRTLLKASQDPFSFHYEAVNNLETHLNDMPVDDLIFFTLTATMLVLFLEKFTDFLSSSAVNKSIDGIGFRLLKHMVQITCNAFAAKKSSFEPQEDESSLEACLMTFSSGLYPSAAMMNHSCDPNIITSFFRNILIVRAGKNVKKGEEIFNCYGPHYRQMCTEQRREILKNQFYFDCECSQCSLTVKNLTNFLCLKCTSRCARPNNSKLSLKCISCNEIFVQKQYDELLHKVELMKKSGHECLKFGNYKEALHLFNETYHFLISFMEYSSPEVEKCSQDIDNCHLNMLSPGYIIERAERTKSHFGKFSIQYAEFLRSSLVSYLNQTSTISDPNSISFADILNYAEELLKIVQYNFGTWSPVYLSMQNLKNALVKHCKT